MGLHSEVSVFSLQSDEELVRIARTGCLRATEQLLRKYRPFVENKARSYFVFGADHEDVVQEGMIGLYKAIRDFRDDRPAHFRSFADLCVTRQIITAIKRATRQKHLPLNAYISFHANSAGDFDRSLLDCLSDNQTGDPGHALPVLRESYGRLEAARHILSPLEARVLEGYLKGQSYQEIARGMRRPAKAIDNALQRIKRKLTGTTLPD